MKNLKLKKFIAGFFLGAVLTSQAFFGLQYVTKPQPAQAFLGIGDITFNTEIGNVYDIIKDIGLAIVKRIAQRYIDKHLTKFIDQLLDKYKIRNYLYYARLLDVYYLNQYIADKIEDPELRQIYMLLSSNVRINIYTTNEADKRKQQKAIAEAKKAVAEFHEKRNNILLDDVLNPPIGMSQIDHAKLSMAYFGNPEEFTEEALYAQIGTMRAQSERASSQELANSDGLQNERTTQEVVVNGMRKMQTIISNPSSFVQNQARSILDSLIKTKTDPNNLWATVGSLLGDYVFKRLDVERNGSGFVIEEYSVSDLVTPALPDGVLLDLDGDGFPDGEDVDGDGALTSLEDICFHGGVPGVGQGCLMSTNVSSSAFFTPLCQGIDRAVAELTNLRDFIVRHADDHLKGNMEDFKNKEDADIWSRRFMFAGNAVDSLMQTVQNYRNPNLDKLEITTGRFSSYINKNIQSLFKDKDLDLKGFGWGNLGAALISPGTLLLGNGDGGGGIDKFMPIMNDYIRYLEDARVAIGKCDNPDFDAVGAIEPPDIPVTGNGCEVPANARGNDMPAPTTAPNIADVVFREAPEVKDWQQTGVLSSVFADPTTITLNYNKANTWPSVLFGIDPNGQEVRAVANPWIMIYRGGVWQATTFSWLKPGQISKAVDDVGCGGIGGGATFGDFQPVAGQTYGFMVSMIARDAQLGAQQAALNGGVQERTNIVMYTWPAGIPGSGGMGGGDGGGSNHICSDNGARNIDYQNSLQTAINMVNNANPNGVADGLNTRAGAIAYLTEVANILRGSQFNLRATTNVLNGNGNTGSGDLIAVWREGDSTMERYDAVIAVGDGDRLMRNASTAGGFTGDIPLVCVF